MKDTYLPQRSKTKKEYIRELIQSDHNYSADDIARIVNTSKENVWKEKSKMISEGLVVSTRRTLKISAERNDETMLLLSSDTNSARRNDILNLKKAAIQSKSLSSNRIKPKSNDNDYSRYVDISPVDSAGMKKMYADFRDKKKPVDIIVEHGFPPAVVQIEYKRFLKFQHSDIQRLQDYIGNDLLKYPLVDAELLEKSYKQKGYLTTDEMIEVLKKKTEYYVRCMKT